ncbi:MAG: hypothetical protein IMW89_05030 [Ktedonobacteraceae bacterium]|nr:hypothetical protein [Ktedonobacteraceae bacterium]
MKCDEMRDMCAILVEASDDRADVIGEVSRRRKPVVIIAQESASHLFQQPGDFAALRYLKQSRGIPITLVLMGSEQMRNYARRQGFTVYASQETCARALARRDRLYAVRSHVVDARVEGAEEGFSRGDPCPVSLCRPGSTERGHPAHKVYESAGECYEERMTGPLVEDERGQKVQEVRRQRGRNHVDAFLLVLVLLVVAGILGGIGFGYLLAMA